MNTSERMRRVKPKDTAPEIVVRTLLKQLGVRFVLYPTALPGSPDIYVPRIRLAIFINGCFWHRHRCKRASMPLRNRAFWEAKFKNNIKRDQDTRKALRRRGIYFTDFWTCQRAEFLKKCQLIARKYRTISKSSAQVT
jgi:DNA mismatch endonuclease (patch repair protein)